MPRIRSVHPGQWSDEDFVQCSPLARLLAIAIRNEADDQGLFEWKPVTLKMRLLPNDTVDVVALLSELEEHNQIRSFEHEGRKFGAIRNFKDFQSPKKPNAVHFMPDELRTYVASKSKSSEPVGNQFGTGSESSPQREKEKEKEKEKDSSGYAFGGRVIRLNSADFERWRQAYPNLDLRAELTALDDYYDANLNGTERKKWFQRCSSALVKRNREAEPRAKAADDADAPPVERLSPERELALENQARAAKGLPPRNLDGTIQWPDPAPPDPGAPADLPSTVAARAVHG